MRKSLLWLMLAVVLVAVSATNAHADSFTYVFTASGATGSAEFTESSILTSTTTISSFTSNTLNLTSLLLAPESGGSCGFLAPGPCIAATFGGPITYFYYFSSNLTSPGAYDSSTGNFGTLEISEVSTAAEPSSVALMLLGVGFVFVLRKRTSRGHQLAT